MHGLAALPIAVFVAAVLACGGDDSSSNGASGGTQPSACPATPCTPGALCFQPAPGSSCDGNWYCWSDTKWHCAPPDAGGPGGGDATVTSEAGPVEAGDEGTTEAGAAETGAEGGGD